MDIDKFLIILKMCDSIETEDSDHSSLVIDLLRMMYISCFCYDVDRSIIELSKIWSKLPDVFEQIIKQSKISSNDIILSISNDVELRRRIMIRRLLDRLNSRSIIMGDSDSIMCTLIIIIALSGRITIYRSIINNTIAGLVQNQLILSKMQPYSQLLDMIGKIAYVLDHELDNFDKIKETLLLLTVCSIITHLRKRANVDIATSSRVFHDNKLLSIELTKLINLSI